MRTIYIRSLHLLERPLREIKTKAKNTLREAEAILEQEDSTNRNDPEMVHAREVKAFTKKLLSLDMDEYVDAVWDDRKISA